MLQKSSKYKLKGGQSVENNCIWDKRALKKIGKVYWNSTEEVYLQLASDWTVILAQIPNSD